MEYAGRSSNITGVLIRRQPCEDEENASDDWSHAAICQKIPEIANKTSDVGRQGRILL